MTPSTHTHTITRIFMNAKALSASYCSFLYGGNAMAARTVLLLSKTFEISTKKNVEVTMVNLI